MTAPDPVYCTLFLLGAFCVGGTLQTCWLRSPWSKRFAIPLDGNLTVRGRRLLGDNKTWTGFIVMVPGVGLGFLLFAATRSIFGAGWTSGFWPLSAPSYFLLGCWGGLGFMLAELPNSFVKRQLGIEPGLPARGVVAGSICFLVDQTDSVLGGLLALALFVPIPAASWATLLLLGPLAHWCFNLVLMLIGVKLRAA